MLAFDGVYQQSECSHELVNEKHRDAGESRANFGLLLMFLGGCTSPSNQEVPPKDCSEQVAKAVAQKPSCPPCGSDIGRHSTRWEPRLSGEKWGYVDGLGYWRIPATWEQASHFSPYGTAIVADDEGFHVIDLKGKILATPFLYDNAPDPVSFGFSRIRDRKSKKVGYLSEAGAFKISPQWDYGTPFQNTKACVCNDCLKQTGEYREVGRGHWMVIDREGKVLRDLGASSTLPNDCSMKVREQSFFEFPFVKR